MRRQALKRVLMTSDTIGGVWNFSVGLASALSAQGIETLLFTMGAPLSPSQQSSLQRAQIGHRDTGLRLEWMQEPWDDVERAGDMLLRLEDEFRPDVVHLNGFCHGAWPFSAPVLVTAHSCVASWWDATLQKPMPEDWAEYRRRVLAGLSGAQLVTAPTEAMKKSLLEFYHFNGAARVIPNGCERPSEIRTGSKHPVILSAGRLWDKSKNIALLEEIARQVAWPICVAGNPQSPEGDEIRFRRVRTLGNLTHASLLSEMAGAQIYAAPALYEPFGLAILEAASLGAALVLSDLPSLRELWDGAALFVDPRKPALWAAALNGLIEKPELIAQLGQKARRRASRYTLQRTVEAYREAYAGLLAAPQKLEACS